MSLARKLIAAHLVDGEMAPGAEVGIRVDQTLTQDATGTLVMQELEALGLDRARTEVSVQYVDHNLLQADERNAEDHEFLRGEDREGDFTELHADPDAGYDVTDHIDLSTVEPLVAKPSSPGNVVPVREVAGEPVSQVVIGSSANPGLRDFAVAAAIVAGRQTSDAVSLDVNPTSRQILTDLTRMGAITDLVTAGARIHQAGCLGCIGMGQAPAVAVPVEPAQARRVHVHPDRRHLSPPRTGNDRRAPGGRRGELRPGLVP